MKLIKLTRGLFTKVDDEDYEYLNQWKWNARKNTYGYYVQRSVWDKNLKKSYTIHMHRLLLKIVDKNLVGDHINHDSLDNQKSNLRTATISQNNSNRKPSGRSSKFLGVSYRKYRNKYISRLRKNTKEIYLGIFDNEIDAAKAYNKAAIEYFGEFANLNIL